MTAFVGPPAPESAIRAHLARQAAQEGQANDVGLGWKVGPGIASLFDAWATQDALDRGGVEANPMMAPFAGSPALYAVKGAEGALVGYLAHRLARSGHRNAAKVVGGIGIGLPLAAGLHNVNAGRN